jgi:ubiquinone/menaquinone biosynthesis C-methylase UbiE
VETRDIRRIYDRVARCYDLVEALPNLLGLSRLRRQIARMASGRVLEVAVGTGANLRHYAGIARLTAVDASFEMLLRARKRARERSLPADFVVADAQQLPCADGEFDTVISTLSVCTFPEPVRALREMRRVVSTAGRILLLEHGRSSHEWIGRWQDRRTPAHVARIGCHPNRDPLALAREAGLGVLKARRVFLGIVFVMVAVARNDYVSSHEHRHHPQED